MSAVSHGQRSTWFRRQYFSLSPPLGSPVSVRRRCRGRGQLIARFNQSRTDHGRSGRFTGSRRQRRCCVQHNFYWIVSAPLRPADVAMCAAVLDDITSRIRCPGERTILPSRPLPAMTPDKKKFLLLSPISHSDKTNWRDGAIEFARVSLTLHCRYFAAQSATTRRSQLRLKQVQFVSERPWTAIYSVGQRSLTVPGVFGRFFLFFLPIINVLLMLSIQQFAY